MSIYEGIQGIFFAAVLKPFFSYLNAVTAELASFRPKFSDTWVGKKVDTSLIPPGLREDGSISYWAVQWQPSSLWESLSSA